MDTAYPLHTNLRVVFRAGTIMGLCQHFSDVEERRDEREESLARANNKLSTKAYVSVDPNKSVCEEE
jgi:hypothetical protein